MGHIITTSVINKTVGFTSILIRASVQYVPPVLNLMSFSAVKIHMLRECNPLPNFPESKQVFVQKLVFANYIVLELVFHSEDPYLLIYG